MNASEYLCTGCQHRLGEHRFAGVYVRRVSCHIRGCPCKNVLSDNVLFRAPSVRQKDL